MSGLPNSDWQKKLDAWRTKNFAKLAKRGEKSRARQYFETIASIVLMVFVIRTGVAEAFRIPSQSMEHTLLIGDFLLVNKFIYGMKSPDWIGVPFTQFGVSLPYYHMPKLRDPEQGDVLVFKYPLDPALNYIKRCIAVGGQTIELRDKRVFVDGKEYPLPKEGFLSDRPMRPKGLLENGIIPIGAGNADNYGPVKVPEGTLFMMGDNRDNSGDSRYWGFLPVENVVGKATVIYLSVDTETPFYRFWEFIRWQRFLRLIN
ncbi:MAG: signal peptidase I [bacterium]|nr:signal peptidase I [bacterium]